MSALRWAGRYQVRGFAARTNRADATLASLIGVSAHGRATVRCRTASQRWRRRRREGDAL